MRPLHLGRWWRTAKNLRWSQWRWRAWFLLQRRLPAWLMRAPATPKQSPLYRPFVPPAAPAGHDNVELMLDDFREGVLRCVNRPLAFDVEAPDWRLGPQAIDRLPIVTLHYHQWIYELVRFADATAGEAAEEAERIARTCLSDWLDKCGDCNRETHSLAWNSYAIATRIGWWIRMLQTDVAKRPDWNSLCDRMRTSLWRQAMQLSTHLEWDIRANHLFRNAVGLAWAGRYFEGASAEAWRSTALAIANEQLEEQILVDGWHYERSVLYHLEFMLDLDALRWLLNDAPFHQKADLALRRMQEAATWMTHPDGRSVQPNDGRRCSADELHVASLARLDRPITGVWMRDAGWIAGRSTSFDVFFDVGPMGPRNQPGHAHADSLTLEASYEGRRLFVDPGNWGYDLDDRRQRERSTAAHNTVACDQSDSSEVWHVFRCGRRASVRDVAFHLEIDGFQASASHDGFAHLAGKPRHQRRVILTGDSLEVRDELESLGSRGDGHDLQGGWLLDPDWVVEEALPDGFRLRHTEGEEVTVLFESDSPLKLAAEDAVVCPDYYTEQPTIRLRWRCRVKPPFRIATRVGPATTTSLRKAATAAAS